MSTDQATQLIDLTSNLYLAVRVLVILGGLLFGGLVFVSYKLGRKP